MSNVDGDNARPGPGSRAAATPAVFRLWHSDYEAEPLVGYLGTRLSGRLPALSRAEPAKPMGELFREVQQINRTSLMHGKPHWAVAAHGKSPSGGVLDHKRVVSPFEYRKLAVRI